jgi:carboxylate-amine ligase
MLGIGDFTIGIEEEYLLVDRETGVLAVEPPEAMLAECEGLVGGQVNPEFLKCQIEASTKICRNVTELRTDLVQLRSDLGSRVTSWSGADCRFHASFRALDRAAPYRKGTL